MGRIFEQGNWDKKDKSNVCPICKTNKEGKIVLIPIKGTEDGHIAEAKQIHLECLLKHLIIYPEQHIIATQYN